MGTPVSPVVAYHAEPRLNADRLAMAVAVGWRAVCRSGDFAAGQNVACISEGSARGCGTLAA